MDLELPDIQAGFRKGRGTRDQIANICWIIEKVREFQKNIDFCFIDYTKAFDCVDHNKLWKILQEMEISDHLTCLLRNLYAGQEATVRTRHGTMGWFKIGKGGHKGCILSPAYLTSTQSSVQIHLLSRVWLCNPMDCVAYQAPLVHGIFQAIVLEWIAISFSRGSSQPRARTQVSCIVDRCFTVWATTPKHLCIQLESL